MTRVACVTQSHAREPRTSLAHNHPRAADRADLLQAWSAAPSNPSHRLHGCERLVVHHVRSTVGDGERSLWFYVEVLGPRPVYTRTIDAAVLAQALGIPGASTISADLEIPGWPVVLQLFQLTSGSRSRVRSRMTRVAIDHVAKRGARHRPRARSLRRDGVPPAAT